jgi:ribosomal protein L11 methyltransferase
MPGDGAGDAAASVTSRRWLAVRLEPAPRPAPESPEAIATRRALIEALIAQGASGVHEDGLALVAHYREGAVNEGDLRSSVARASVGARLDISWVDDADWAHQWRQGIGAHRIGRFTVTPPWLKQEATAETTIVIDPGMGFGTGEHPTTRGALQLLATVVRQDDFVVDIGTGSGVLGIAAAKLGAGRVAAIELDADAIGNAESNIIANGVEDRVVVIEGDGAQLLPMLAPVDVVVANIISSVLVALLPAIASALGPGGRAILSGILAEERTHMRGLLTAGGWRLGEETTEGTWWSTVVARQ